MNPLYEGHFNNNREILTEWCRASSEKEAFRILTARIAVKLGRSVTSVRAKYNGEKDNFKIREVKDGRVAGQDR